MFAEPDDEEKRVFPLVLHRSLARGRYILWMGKSVNLKGGQANKKNYTQLLFWSSSPSGLGLTSNITNSEQLDQFSFGLCVYSSAVVLVNLKLWFQARSDL